MTGLDAFANEIDPSVGYARGPLLRSSADEVRRLRNAQRIAGDRVRALGPDSISIFTGNPRYFPLTPHDLDTACEEWVGPGLFADELKTAAIDHLGGQSNHAAAVFNRTSAGIVAAILALAEGRPVVSIVPNGDRSHASVVRGCRLAQVSLVEVFADEDVSPAIVEHGPRLVIVTTVTSTLARMTDDDAEAAITAAHIVGATVLMDEAYGARLRPILHEGKKSLALGGDIAVTNADKAGLSGPRAGVMAGRADAVVAVQAKASELGMEARAPIAAGAMRSLQAFDPGLLRSEAQDGQAIADALAARVGEATILRSDLGPMLGEDAVTALVCAQSGQEQISFVPAEITAAIGMVLLREKGILTVNTHGQPGGRVSIRLKPTAGAVERVGGAEAVAQALEAAIAEVSAHIGDAAWMAETLFGEGSGS